MNRLGTTEQSSQRGTVRDEALAARCGAVAMEAVVNMESLLVELGRSSAISDPTASSIR